MVIPTKTKVCSTKNVIAASGVHTTCGNGGFSAGGADFLTDIIQRGMVEGIVVRLVPETKIA